MLSNETNALGRKLGVVSVEIMFGRSAQSRMRKTWLDSVTRMVVVKSVLPI